MISFSITLTNARGTAGRADGSINRGRVEIGEIQWDANIDATTGISAGDFWVRIRMDATPPITMCETAWFSLRDSGFLDFLRLLALSPDRAQAVCEVASVGRCFRAEVFRHNVQESCTVFSSVGDASSALAVANGSSFSKWEFSASCGDHTTISKIQEIPLSQMITHLLDQAVADTRESAGLQAIRLIRAMAKTDVVADQGSSSGTLLKMVKESRSIICRVDDVICPGGVDSRTRDYLEVRPGAARAAWLS